MDGATGEADDRTTAPRTPRPSRLTPAGVAAIVAGVALATLGGAAPLWWLGVSLVLLGVSLVGTPLTTPSGTGEEDSLAVTLPDGRTGSAFAWSRFAPGMTVVVMLSSAGFLVGLGLVFLSLELLLVAAFCWALGLFVVARTMRFVPVLRGRQLLVTADGVVVVLRGERVELPWATITAIDVASPAPPLAEMGGAITLRTLEHEVPGSERMRRRLTNLARAYGTGADIALPVAGLRHDPGALLAALERRGRPG